MLVCALVVVAVASRVGAPGIRGQAIAVWPQPPAVGSCLDTGQPGGQVVPCSQPHEAEVTRTFEATDPLLSAETSAFDGQLTPRFFKLCLAAAEDYIGVPRTAISDATSGSAGDSPSEVPSEPGLTVLPPDFVVSTVAAPQDQRVGDLGWVACTVQPDVPAAYTGAVRHLGSRIPAAYGTCFNSDRNASSGDVSCTSEHGGQTLATASVITALSAAGDVTMGSSPLAGTVSAQCKQIAATQMGTLDPTYGGVLAVSVLVGAGTVVFSDNSGQPDPSVKGSPAARYQVDLSCVVRPVGDGMLTDSMVGWGSRPPPLR